MRLYLFYIFFLIYRRLLNLKMRFGHPKAPDRKSKFLHLAPAFITFLLLPMVVIILPVTGLGQVPDTSMEAERETANYLPYDSTVAGRFYFSRKYTSFKLDALGKNAPAIHYRPNTTLNMGVGVTYDWLTINLAVGFDFLNKSRKDYGTTNYLDLQSHIFAKRFNLDVFGQFYRGYYQQTSKTAPLYNRFDIRLTQVGINYERLFNWKNFSFRASMLQTEKQFKSAGTALAGAHISYTQAHGDSSMVPDEDIFKSLPDIKRITAFRIGPSIGYAYTLVILKSFFLTGALSGQLNLYHTYESDGYLSQSRVSGSPNLLTKGAAGFNRTRWNISLVMINQGLLSNANQFAFSGNTGRIQLHFAYRFIPRAKFYKRFGFVEKWNPARKKQ